jgi:hypothetical protein
MVNAGLFFEHQAQSHQKQMRHKSLGSMMIPTDPATSFIVIHAQFVFAFFQGRFHRPTETANPNQLGVRA